MPVAEKVPAMIEVPACWVTAPPSEIISTIWPAALMSPSAKSPVLRKRRSLPFEFSVASATSLRFSRLMPLAAPAPLVA